MKRLKEVIKEHIKRNIESVILAEPTYNLTKEDIEELKRKIENDISNMLYYSRNRSNILY